MLVWTFWRWACAAMLEYMLLQLTQTQSIINKNIFERQVLLKVGLSTQIVGLLIIVAFVCLLWKLLSNPCSIDTPEWLLDTDVGWVKICIIIVSCQRADDDQAATYSSILILVPAKSAFGWLDNIITIQSRIGYWFVHHFIWPMVSFGIIIVINIIITIPMIIIITVLHACHHQLVRSSLQQRLIWSNPNPSSPSLSL